MSTTTISTRDAVTALVDQVLAGQALEAFDRFYAEDVTMRENNGEPTVGKAADRAREEKFFGSLEAFHGGSAPVVLVDGDRAMINWVFDVTFKGGQRVVMDQVAVQEWRDGEIVSERFYYDTAS